MMSFTATMSRSAPRSTAMRMTARPIRPNPLMATRVGMLSSFDRSEHDTNAIGRPRCDVLGAIMARAAPAWKRPGRTGQTMANGSSSEREYALLVAQLGALDQDIATARATAWRGAHPAPMQFHAHHDPPPAPTGERVHLADGAEVVIPPVEPGDRHEIDVGFAQLSAMSRLQSYRQPVEHLSRRELAALTHIDHESEEGMVALDPATGTCVAGARFVRSK